jgi:hypothetical protein
MSHHNYYANVKQGVGQLPVKQVVGPLPIQPVKNSLSSSEIQKKLSPVDKVLGLYSKMKTESEVGTLAVKLARQAFFGDDYYNEEVYCAWCS